MTVNCNGQRFIKIIMDSNDVVYDIVVDYNDFFIRTKRLQIPDMLYDTIQDDDYLKDCCCSVISSLTAGYFQKSKKFDKRS